MSGLPLSEEGFLQVHDTLQSVGDPAVFGTGDCISLTSQPDLHKNGVHAVREGAILFENVKRFLQERPLTRFRSQKFCLCLMNTSDGSAVFNYGPIVWKGRLARQLKHRIDQAWMDKFTRFPAMPTPGPEQQETAAMRCGGCGSKISSDVLSAVLKRLDVGNDPRVLLGCRAGEDAAVHRMRPELFGKEPDQLVEVQTVDYFKAFLDDPYHFGWIAAIHALSDLYAMNARPFSALAIATLPYARGPVQEAMLYELLSGALRPLRRLGVTLTGGHTTEGSELSLGFAVTGYAEENALFQKSLLQPGDLLVLTKPLGSGALLAAWMRGECRAEWFVKLLHGLDLANDRVPAVLERYGVRACTDVTGFGLAGHLLEMLDASRVSVRLDLAAVPLYDGFTEVVDRGIVSTLQRDNAKIACRIQAPEPPPAFLFDPQTSGGLLAGIKPARAADVVRSLIEGGYSETTIIGEVVPLEGTEPVIEVSRELPLSAKKNPNPRAKPAAPRCQER
jgi:selenide,water dikinase